MRGPRLDAALVEQVEVEPELVQPVEYEQEQYEQEPVLLQALQLWLWLLRLARAVATAQFAEQLPRVAIDCSKPTKLDKKINTVKMASSCGLEVSAAQIVIVTIAIAFRRRGAAVPKRVKTFQANSDLPHPAGPCT